MYVINPKILKLDTLYACGKTVSDWLTYTCDIPFISHDSIKGQFYYTHTDALKEALAKMPFSIKLASIIF